MDILLINPKDPYNPFPQSMPPLGLSAIGTIMEKNGFTVQLLDLEIKMTNFDLAGYIKNATPKIIGIGGTTHSRYESFKIAEIAKMQSRPASIVYGGSHATFTAVDTLSNVPYIDYIVHGEGEYTFLELARFLLSNEGRIADIKGISYRDGGLIKTNLPRERISDLDVISYSRHLLEMDRYRTMLDFIHLPAAHIMTSRGCPFNCSFCSASALFGRTVTTRSAINVADEIEYCIRCYRIKGVKFYDSTFTVDSSHVKALTEELLKRSIRLPWECEIRADSADRDMLERMKKAGCYYVDIGVETGSQTVLDRMHKACTMEQAASVLSYCKELGLRTKVFISFGHIGETWDDTEKTFSFIEKHDKEITLLVVNHGVIIYPGTQVEQYALKHNLLPKDFSWSRSDDDRSQKILFYHGAPILVQPFYGIDELRRTVIRKLRLQIKSIHRIINALLAVSSPSDFGQKIRFTVKTLTR